MPGGRCVVSGEAWGAESGGVVCDRRKCDDCGTRCGSTCVAEAVVGAKADALGFGCQNGT